MHIEKTLEVPYLLLTPGPLTTTSDVREAMLKDWCTWDADYNNLVQDMRRRLLDIGVSSVENYTTVLMQGSGTFTVESVIGSSTGAGDKLLVVTNGAYGRRIAQIAEVLGIDNVVYETEETSVAAVEDIRGILEEDKGITHVAMVHCETTTGILNPIYEVGEAVKELGRTYIVDAMSSFGGIEIDVEKLGADFLISSSNKCIQGVPGFAFVIAKKSAMDMCQGNARSLSLDLYDQWKVMEENNGKWRYTSPTHVVRAFYQALIELEAEGGVAVREKRYRENQDALVEGMKRLGFKAVVEREVQSPIITSFFYPEGKRFEFLEFYEALKEKGFVIYPGKLTETDTFRIGNIGDVHREDIERLLKSVEEVV